MAAVFCILLIIPSIFVYVVQNYLLKEGSYVTVSGQMMATEQRKISWFIQYPFFILSIAAVLIIISLFSVIFISSITKIFMINNKLTRSISPTTRGGGPLRPPLPFLRLPR